MYDVLIVGAGPAGCRTAELVAKGGFKVLVLEEHLEIGKPVSCSALVSHRILDVSGVSRDVIVNTVRKARFYSAKRNCLELRSKKPVYVMNRERFDKEIAGNARKAGTKIKKSTKFESFSKEKDCLRVKTSKGTFETKLLVGADGVRSKVADLANLPLPDNLFVTAQKTVKSSFDADAVELWFGADVCPDFFCWIIPENKEWARIGLATPRHGMKYLEKFIRNRIRKKTCKDVMGGLIRFGLMKDTVADRVLLVGDAASQVKPFSGGGLTYGQIGASYAADACIKSLENERYDYGFLKENYDEKWKAKLAWPIRKGFVMNRLVHLIPDWLFNFSVNVGSRFKFLLEDMDMDLL